MSEDAFVDAIDRVGAAADELQGAVSVAVEALQAARAERLRGVDMLDIVGRLVDRDGQGLRSALRDGYRQLEHAITMTRAAAVRALVDDVGMSFTEIGRLTGVSRQMIARLYRLADARESFG